MSACEQEMCPNWDGHTCPCETFDLPKPCSHPAFIEDEWGHRLCVRCDYEWWEDPL